MTVHLKHLFLVTTEQGCCGDNADANDVVQTKGRTAYACDVLSGVKCVPRWDANVESVRVPIAMMSAFVDACVVHLAGFASPGWTRPATGRASTGAGRRPTHREEGRAMSGTSKQILGVAVIVVVTLALAACSGDGGAPAPTRSVVVSFAAAEPTAAPEPTATPFAMPDVTRVPRPWPTVVLQPTATVPATAEPDDDGEGELFGLEPLRDPTPTAVPGATPDLRVPHVERYFRDEYRGGSADLFRAASNEHREGRVGQAFAGYRAVIEERGLETPSVLHRLGRIQQAVGNHLVAAEYFGWVIEIRDFPAPRWNRALSLLRAGRCDEAVEDASALLDGPAQAIGDALTWAPLGQGATTELGAHYVMAVCHGPNRNVVDQEMLTRTGFISSSEDYQRIQSGERDDEWPTSACSSLFAHWAQGAEPRPLRPAGVAAGYRGAVRPCANEWSDVERQAVFIQHANAGLRLAAEAGMTPCPRLGEAAGELDCTWLRRYFEDAAAAPAVLDPGR